MTTSRPAATAAAIETIATTVIDSPLGSLLIAASAHGLRAVLWGVEDARVSLGAGAVPADHADVGDDQRAILTTAVAQLREYFAGERVEFDVPLDPVGTPFQHDAWQQLRLIPYGETITYGEQARRLGDPNKSRAVGTANGRNPLSIIVPCHRVVGANGSLTGFAGGLQNKAWLLDHERRVWSDALG